MDFKTIYKEKLTTVEQAAQTVKSGDWVDYGFCLNHPVAFDKALAARKDKLKDINLRGGVELWVPEVMKIPAEESPFTWNSTHMSGAVRNLTQQGNAFYLPIRFSETPRYYRENAPAADVVVFQVTPMDEHGFFNFGPSASQIAASCDRGKVIIVEVNTNIPKCYGGLEADIHISKVNMIIEGDNPMPSVLPAVNGTPTDEAIARLIVEEIPSGACLQLGIGGMPGVVGKILAQSDVKDLGVHSEMYVDAFVELSKAGKVTGKYKALDRYRQGFSFAAGTQDLYDFINANPEILAAPVDYINDIRVISAMDKFISVNSCVEVDLFGQVNAETAGLRHISGSGGQQDFVLGAYLSKGGKSFIALPSTYKTKDGTLKSRLIDTMPQGSVITDTRTNIHYLVTENGKANLKGLTTWQRAEAIISIAHPQFQDELVAQAEKMNIWRKANKRNH